VQCAWLMDRNLGLLMDWAAENSVQVADYFKPELIREHEEEEPRPRRLPRRRRQYRKDGAEPEIEIACRRPRAPVGGCVLWKYA
jgi:hypothetical protein